ncbi:hypothetical protein CRUP_016913 [Coryphaenoides rupestris]|nr:hypothetical protein CRUP_016913 [Coryphaenoides rupestris]
MTKTAVVVVTTMMLKIRKRKMRAMPMMTMMKMMLKMMMMRVMMIHVQDTSTGVMFNASAIELNIHSREDLSEVINGTAQRWFDVPAAVTVGSPTAMGNESCGEQLLDFGRPEKMVIGVMLAIITAITVMGNTLVVIAVCVVKKLRQPSNYLLVSLAVADLSVAIVVMPFVIVTDLTGGKWLFGEVFCNIFIGMDVMCCTASIMTLCVISVDR